MKGLNRALFRKELALQKTNMMFTLGTVLLGSIALVLFSVVEFKFANVTSSDLKNMVMFMAVGPLLLGVIPVMMGATAAAAEKPLGVLAWQDSLPVGRWRVAAIKLGVVALGVCVVSGVLPFVFIVLHSALADGAMGFASAFEVLFMLGSWSIPVGLICAAAGFYTGTYSRNDYQALLMAVIPLGLVVYVIFLADPLGRVFPFIMGGWPTKPLVLTGRLVIIAGLFAGLGCRLLGRMPRRRWIVMVGHGVLVAIVVFGLTLWNVIVEYRVLNQVVSTSRAEVMPPNPGSERYSAVITVASVRPQNPGAHCSDFLTHLEEVNLPGEERMALGYVRRQCSSFVENKHPRRPFLVISDTNRPELSGFHIIEFPQAAVENYRITGVAKNKRWIQTEDMLFGPWGLAVRRSMIPQGWFDKLAARVGIESLIRERGAPTLMEGEVFVGRGPEHGIAWHDGKKYVQSAADYRPALNSLEMEDPDHVRVMVQSRGTTSVAILKPMNAENLPFRYELAGWTSGLYGAVSPDYKWAVSTGSERSEFVVASLEVDSPVRDGVTSDSAAQVWAIPPRRELDEATSLSLAFVLDPFLKIGSQNYIMFSYIKGNLGALQDPNAQNAATFEMGVMVFDPELGREQFFPVQNLERRWFSGRRSLDVQGNGSDRALIASPDGSMTGLVFSVAESGILEADKIVYLRGGERSKVGMFLNDYTFIYSQSDRINLALF